VVETNHDENPKMPTSALTLRRFYNRRKGGDCKTDNAKCASCNSTSSHSDLYKKKQKVVGKGKVQWNLNISQLQNPPNDDAHDSTSSVVMPDDTTPASSSISNPPFSPSIPLTPPSTPMTAPNSPDTAFIAPTRTSKSTSDPPHVELSHFASVRKRSYVHMQSQMERTVKYMTVPILEGSVKRIRSCVTKNDLIEAATAVLEDLKPIRTESPEDSLKPLTSEWGDTWRTLDGLTADHWSSQVDKPDSEDEEDGEENN